MALSTFTLPPDNRSVGSGNPPQDVNGLVDAVNSLGVAYSVLNTAYNGGADPTGANDSTTAFADCVAAAATAGLPVIIPGGTYKVNATLNWKIPGLQVITGGAQKTIINMSTANTPILQVAGEGQRIGGLTLRYPTQQTSGQTSSIGVEFGDDSIGSCFLSIFEDLRVYQSAKGLATNPAITGTASGVFSCQFGNVEVFGYSISAIDLNGGNGTGAGNTGCVFDNVYVHNNFTGTPVTSSAWPVILRNWSEVVFNELNIEKCIISAPALQFAECGAVVINSLHLEGIQAGGTNLALLGAGTQVGSVVVNAMSVRFSTFTGSSSNSVVQFTGGAGQSVEIHGLNMPTSDGGNSTPILALADFNGIANASVTVSGVNPLGPLYSTIAINPGSGSQVYALGAEGINAAVLGADPSGATDSTADINNALAAGSLVRLPAGTYLLNTSTALALNRAGTVLAGAGKGATILKIGSSLSAAQAIAITANFCQVRDLSIVGTSSTVTSNPVANGIEVTGAQFCTVRDVFFQYVNGWAIESVGGSSVANIGCRFNDTTGYNCGGGVHVKGVTGSSFGGQQWITNPHYSQIGTATTNLDGIMIEDCADVYVSNYDGAISDVGTGSTLHVKGLCSSIFIDDFDLGVFPNGTPNNSALKIEDSSNGSPGGIHLNTGILQQAQIGATVSGAGSRLYFSQVDFSGNSTHGLTLSGTGTGLYLDDCTFRGNGAGASGANYDLNVTSTATGKARGCRFLTSVTTTGVAGVQAVVNLSVSGQNIPFIDCDFAGTGVTLSTVFLSNIAALIRNCKNYNPKGSSTVTVPATTVATVALHFDSVFYITAGASTCTIVKNTAGQGGGGGPSVVIPSGGFASVYVPAQATITPTYTSAPTWVVDGL